MASTKSSRQPLNLATDDQRLNFVKECILEVTGSDDDVTPNASLMDDLEMDSLDLVELTMTIEERLDIPEIDEREAEGMKSVQDVMNVVAKHSRKM